MVTESAKPGLGRCFERILPINDWHNNGTGNDAQLTTRFGFAGGSGSNTFGRRRLALTFAAKIVAGKKKQIRVSRFQTK